MTYTTEILRALEPAAIAQAAARAAEVLAAGEVVAIPTETVYGCRERPRRRSGGADHEAKDGRRATH